RRPRLRRRQGRRPGAPRRGRGGAGRGGAPPGPGPPAGHRAARARDRGGRRRPPRGPQGGREPHRPRRPRRGRLHAPAERGGRWHHRRGDPPARGALRGGRVGPLTAASPRRARPERPLPERLRQAAGDVRTIIEGNRAGRDLNIYLAPEPPEPADQRWLRELAASVRREVELWLADEVRDGPLLHTPKPELSEAVGRRRPVLVSARAEDRLLDPSDALGTVFVEEAGRSLLILGAPGAGKSVLLHQLARDLLDRARDDPREPVPVPLSLGGWT